MSKWNSKKKICIPGMETPKNILCKVCGSKIIPNKKSRYTAKDRLCTGGVSSALNGNYTESKEYDAFDCNIFGCQLLAQERLKKVEKIDESKGKE